MFTFNGMVYYIPKNEPRKVMALDPNTAERMNVIEADQPLFEAQVIVPGGTRFEKFAKKLQKL